MLFSPLYLPIFLISRLTQNGERGEAVTRPTVGILSLVARDYSGIQFARNKTSWTKEVIYQP